MSTQPGPNVLNMITEQAKSEQVDIAQLRERLRATANEANQFRNSADSFRRELISHREKAQGNYWAWQGDETDKLESLSIPVLIWANDLQAIIERAEKAESLVRSYDRQDETVGPELAESVDSVTDIIQILKERAEKAEAAAADLRDARIAVAEDPNDLNAMHEVEVEYIIPNGLWDEYASHLKRSMRDGERFWGQASARQRCEAFLRTLGKWKD